MLITFADKLLENLKGLFGPKEDFFCTEGRFPPAGMRDVSEGCGEGQLVDRVGVVVFAWSKDGQQRVVFRSDPVVLRPLVSSSERRAILEAYRHVLLQSQLAVGLLGYCSCDCKDCVRKKSSDDEGKKVEKEESNVDC